MFKSRCRICETSYGHHLLNDLDIPEVCHNRIDKYSPSDNLEYLEWCYNKQNEVKK